MLGSVPRILKKIVRWTGPMPVPVTGNTLPAPVLQMLLVGNIEERGAVTETVRTKHTP